MAILSVERFALAFTSSYKIVLLGMTQSQIVALLALGVALPWTAWLASRRPKVTTLH